MLRNILVLFPALALAVPLVASARPLATSVEEATYEPAKPGKPYEPTKPGKGEAGGEATVQIGLAFCMAVQVLAEDRACEIKEGDACLAACDEAVGDGESCRSACETDSAAFCGERFKPGKKPTKPGKQPTKPGTEPYDEEGGGLIFVNLEQCFALGVNIDIKN